MENHKLSLSQTLTAIAAVVTAITGFISLFNHENSSLQEQTYNNHTVRPEKTDPLIAPYPNKSLQYHYQINRDGQNNINGHNIKNDGIIIMK